MVTIVVLHHKHMKLFQAIEHTCYCVVHQKMF